ncbi:MAG: UvrD-helicase domain-containing protein [Erysipelothrix sp.]|nr:UvrD-helicase domain-containing protein [Erysipelothrix sp.]
MWTNEQIEAINIIDINTTVSASAGAGKTAVLVERLMKRILIDKVSVDEIVSLTFTDAAAAEMKNRLMSALLSKQAEDPDNQYILEQITLLPNANISTIHSFCLRLLKDYYYVLGINPDSLNNIISESDKLQVQKQAFEYAISNYDSNKIADLMTYLSNNALNLNRINDIIKVLVDKANETIDPEAFIVNSVAAYRQYQRINDLPEPFLSLFYNELRHELAILNQSIMAAINYLDALDSDIKRDDHTAWLQALLNGVFTLYEQIDQQDYQAFVDNFDRISALPSKTLSKHKDFTVLRGDIIDNLDAIAASLYDEKDALAHLAVLEYPLTILKDLALMYNDYFKKEIIRLNKITFNDMETLTYQLLKANDNEIAKILSQQISDILVDEFQDTNQLQNEIIKLLGNGRNIFRVGDVKQSIYRFRGAQPEIMQSLIDQGETEDHKTIYLSKNFRSKDTIVEYNNHLFRNIMNVDGFRSSYDQYDSVQVGTDNQKENNVPVELILINSKSDSLDEEQAEMDSQFLKASYIANKMVEMVKDEEDPNWKKFTVLANAHSIKHPLKRAFDEANIPYFIALPDGLYETEGVATMLAYLSLINDPSDKVALMTLLTVLYGHSDNTIAKLFINEKSLVKVANILEPSLMELVYKYNASQYRQSISEIVNELMMINDFYELKLSKQNRTNFDIFYEDIIEYDLDKVGIYGFLKKIDLIKQAKAKEGSSISSEDNVVNVMTIHNSKGLQFENVFLMSKSQYRDNDASSKFMIHSKLGLAIKTSIPETRIEHNNLIHNLIKKVDRQESIEEDMRVLYVALTRAQNKLFIVDTVAIKGDDTLAAINLNKSEILASSFTKWIGATHYHEPSRYLNQTLVEEFTQELLPALIKPSLELVKRDEYQLSKFTIESNYVPNKLSLSQVQLGSDIGSLVHNTLEKLVGHSWSRAYILDIAADLSNYYVDRLVNLGSNDFFKALFDKEVLKEVPFVYANQEQSIRGIIDMVAISDDEVIIVDFKTDNLEHEIDFVDRYASQLDFYADALALEYPDHKISKYIYSLKHETFIKLAK